MKVFVRPALATLSTSLWRSSGSASSDLLFPPAFQPGGGYRRRPGPYSHNDYGTAKGKGQGKHGKEKGQYGKDKGKVGKGFSQDSQAARWEAKTPDGKRICFAYNNPRERCTCSCNMEHVCRICFGKHPVHMHKDYPAAGGGDGSG